MQMSEQELAEQGQHFIAEKDLQLQGSHLTQE